MGRGEKAAAGGSAASASVSSEPDPAALTLRSVSRSRIAARSVSACRPFLPSSCGKRLPKRRPRPVQPPLLSRVLLREERGGHGVRDLGRPVCSVVRSDDVDDVGLRIDRRGDLVFERGGGFAREALRRAVSRIASRQQCVDRREATLDGVAISDLEGIGGALEDDLRGRLVRLREQQRDEQHDAHKRQHDECDQQLAATKGIQIPARLDRLVRREGRRRVPDQAVGAIDHLLVATVARPGRTLLAALCALLAVTAGCSSSSTQPLATDAPSRPPAVAYPRPHQPDQAGDPRCEGTCALGAASSQSRSRSTAVLSAPTRRSRTSSTSIRHFFHPDVTGSASSRSTASGGVRHPGRRP